MDQDNIIVENKQSIISNDSSTNKENNENNAKKDDDTPKTFPVYPDGFISQKEMLLRYRPPQKNGKQIIRYPTSTSYGSVDNQFNNSVTNYDPRQHFVEICVNTGRNKNRTSSNNTDNGSDFDDYDDEECTIPRQSYLLDEEEARLLSLAQSIIEQRLIEMETPAQRQLRIERKREKMRLYYASETEEQRAKRLAKARDYKRKQKMRLEKVETPEQRIERLKKQRERQRRFYARETEEQRRRRLDKVREYQRKRKEAVTSGPGSGSGGEH